MILTITLITCRISDSVTCVGIVAVVLILNKYAGKYNQVMFEMAISEGQPVIRTVNNISNTFL